MLKHSIKTGLSFGLTSGIITTLGLMVGLHSGTHSRFVVLGGILTIAVADSFSDALGIHISEESENKHSRREIWESSLATFLSKFIFALTFVVPILVFSLPTAIFISIAWGLLLIGFFSFQMAKEQKKKPTSVIFEHLIITVAVITITHFLGDWISTFS